MRFKAFMEDAALPNKPTSKKITELQALKWVKTNAPTVMKHVQNGSFNFYRGMAVKGNYHYGNSADFKRVSLNTQNYYNKFIATSKNWSSFPSRESAFVGATSPGIAGGYGDLYFIIPADSAMIGLCPSHDLWKSFPELEKIDLNSLNSLNDILISLMQRVEKKIIPDNQIEELRKSMRTWNAKRLMDIAFKKIGYESHVIQTIVEFMVDKGFNNFEDLIDQLLDPRKNGFEVMRASAASLPIKPGKEAWLEGEAIFVREAEMKEFLEKYNDL